MSSGGKGGVPGSNLFFGSCAGIVSLGPLDFVWGLMLNNALVWPTAKVWTRQIYQAGTVILYTNGNVYTTAIATNAVPPGAPWTLYAAPWAAGSYAANAIVVRNGNLWKNTSGGANALAPPTVAPNPNTAGTGSYFFPYAPVNGWTYQGTPIVWVGGSLFLAGAIVAHKGALYQTSANTYDEPPAAPWTRWRVTRAGHANPLKITVPNHGDCYLYWGTDNQTLGGGETFLTAAGHPAYRHRAVLVLQNFLFGTEVVSPPDMTVMGGRSPVQTLIGGAAANMDADWMVNPWCVLAELLTHPVYGLGLPNAMFDATTWQAEADRCAANPQLYYISPLYDRLVKARDIASDLLGYPDAFVFWNTVAKLQAGHWPHHEDAPAFDDTNTISRDNLIEEPSWDTDGWGATANSVEVSFRDQQAAFRSRPVRASNLFNRTVLRRLQAKRVERPHIVRLKQAVAVAQEFAKIEGDQVCSGTAKIRPEGASAIRQGSIFRFTDDVLGVSAVMRCTAKTIAAPPEGSASIEFATERGVAPAPYSPTPEDPPPSEGAAPTPITTFQFVQLPFELAGEDNALACLVARADTSTKSVQIWFRQADNAALQLLGTVRGFAVSGKVNFAAGPTQGLGIVTAGNTYPLNDKQIYAVFRVDVDTDGDGLSDYVAAIGADYTFDDVNGAITIVNGGAIATGMRVWVIYTLGAYILAPAGTPSDDIEGLSVPLTQDEINDNKILVFGFQGADPTKFEIMSLKSFGASSGSGYFLNLWGKQYGTLKGGTGNHTWGQGDYMFVLFKSDLVTLLHQAFAGLEEAGSTADFVLAPASQWYQADPADLYDPASDPNGLSTQVTFTFANLFAPQPKWISLQKNGVDIASFAGTFLTTDVFEFMFEVFDLNADMVRGSLVGYLGEQETVLWASSFDKTAQLNKTVEFQLGVGLWRMALIVADAAGNSTTLPLTLVGSTTEETLNVDAPATTTTQTPPLGPFAVFVGYICLARFGPLPAGLTVKYQLQNRGVAYNGAAWVVAASLGGGYYGYVPNFPALTKTLYAYCHKAGQTDSKVVHWNL